jgi:hypothetical protein
MDVKKSGCRLCKVAQWNDCVAEDFGVLAGVASSCPGAAILHARPHETLCTQFRRCFGALVR